MLSVAFVVLVEGGAEFGPFPLRIPETDRGAYRPSALLGLNRRFAQMDTESPSLSSY